MKIVTLYILFYESYLSVSKLEFDKEHFEAYPYCGRLFGYEWHDARSRVVNSKESDIQYPWVVLVKNTYVYVYSKWGQGPMYDPVLAENYCTGTIVGNK